MDQGSWGTFLIFIIMSRIGSAAFLRFSLATCALQGMCGNGELSYYIVHKCSGKETAC